MGGAGGIVQGLRAVPYTHLDVYKRQQQGDQAVHRPGLRRVVGQLMGAGEGGVQPVSYTHLDVYKRQPLYRALAANYGAAFLDAGEVIAVSPVDGVHFDAAAHAALADAVAGALRQMV